MDGKFGNPISAFIFASRWLFLRFEDKWWINDGLMMDYNCVIERRLNDYASRYLLWSCSIIGNIRGLRVCITCCVLFSIVGRCRVSTWKLHRDASLIQRICKNVYWRMKFLRFIFLRENCCWTIIILNAVSICKKYTQEQFLNVLTF